MGQCCSPMAASDHAQMWASTQILSRGKISLFLFAFIDVKFITSLHSSVYRSGHTTPSTRHHQPFSCRSRAHNMLPFYLLEGVFYACAPPPWPSLATDNKKNTMSTRTTYDLMGIACYIDYRDALYISSSFELQGCLFLFSYALCWICVEYVYS